MSRAPRLLRTTLLGVLCASTLGVAHAQEARPDSTQPERIQPVVDPDATAIEIRNKLRTVRNDPLLRRSPTLRDNLIRELLDTRLAMAEDGLRDILLDDRIAGADLLLEQISVAVLARGGHRLLDDVLRRVTREQGEEQLAGRLKPLWSSFAHIPGNVDRVRDLASSDDVEPRLREEALRVLGELKAEEALATLHQVWTTGPTDLRRVARDAFATILNAPDLSPETAARYVRDVEEVGLLEVQRRILARWPDTDAVAPEVWRAEYLRLARHALAPLDARRALALDLLQSPSDEIRLEAAQAFGRARIDDPEVRARSVTGLLAALPSAPTEEVSIALVDGLLNPSFEASLSGALPAAVQERVESWLMQRTSHSRKLRMRGIALVGRLRDPHFLPLLEQAYENEQGGDVELRLELVNAVERVAPSSIEWRVAQLEQEKDKRLVEGLLLSLGRAGLRDEVAGAEVVPVLARRLTAESDVGVRRVTAAVLARLWSTLRPYPAARDALIAALDDADASVRETAANALANVPAGEDHTTPAVAAAIDALVARVTLGEGLEEEPVRLAATQAILDLAGRTAAERLVPALGNAVVREQFVQFVVQRAVAAGDPSDLLADASTLAAANREWAVELLTAAVHAREVDEGLRLWDAPAELGGRGAVMKRLARYLVDERRPDDALRYVQRVNTEVDDPDARLLEAYALRRAGAPAQLREALALLLKLRSETQPTAARGQSVRLETAATWLDLDRPRQALAALGEVPVEVVEDASVRERHAALLARAKERDAEILRRLEGWVAALGGSDEAGRAEAAKSLKEAPHAPAYLLGCLDGAEDGSARQLSLVRAGELLVGVALIDDAGFADPAARKTALEQLRERLGERAKESLPASNR